MFILKMVLTCQILTYQNENIKSGFYCLTVFFFRLDIRDYYKRSSFTDYILSPYCFSRHQSIVEHIHYTTGCSVTRIIYKLNTVYYTTVFGGSLIHYTSPKPKPAPRTICLTLFCCSTRAKFS